MLGCAELLIQLQHRRTVSVSTTSTSDCGGLLFGVEVLCIAAADQGRWWFLFLCLLALLTLLNSLVMPGT